MQKRLESVSAGPSADPDQDLAPTSMGSREVVELRGEENGDLDTPQQEEVVLPGETGAGDGDNVEGSLGSEPQGTEVVPNTDPPLTEGGLQ